MSFVKIVNNYTEVDIDGDNDGDENDDNENVDDENGGVVPFDDCFVDYQRGCYEKENDCRGRKLDKYVNCADNDLFNDHIDDDRVMTVDMIIMT